MIEAKIGFCNGREASLAANVENFAWPPKRPSTAIGHLHASQYACDNA